MGWRCWLNRSASGALRCQRVVTSLLLNLCFVSFCAKMNAKAPTFHGSSIERLAPLSLSPCDAWAGAETDILVSPKLSFGQGLVAQLELTFSCRPD